MFGNFNTYMYAKQLDDLEQQINDLRTVSGYSVEQLTYLFAKGYTFWPKENPYLKKKELENEEM